MLPVAQTLIKSCSFQVMLNNCHLSSLVKFTWKAAPGLSSANLTPASSFLFLCLCATSLPLPRLLRVFSEQAIKVRFAIYCAGAHASLGCY